MTSSSTFNAASGDGYELQMGRWSRRLAEPFLDFVGTAPGEQVLDLGCGTGSLSFALAARCPPSGYAVSTLHQAMSTMPLAETGTRASCSRWATPAR